MSFQQHLWRPNDLSRVQAIKLHQKHHKGVARVEMVGQIWKGTLPPEQWIAFSIELGLGLCRQIPRPVDANREIGPAVGLFRLAVPRKIPSECGVVVDFNAGDPSCFRRTGFQAQLPAKTIRTIAKTIDASSPIGAGNVVARVVAFFGPTMDKGHDQHGEGEKLGELIWHFSEGRVYCIKFFQN